ncbi:MAG: RsmB/NOP family class I SAM-dependent RNA methyltransferase [Anaerobiospirillum succiniciproducens]|uniref:RsmB/NOP family class I SAM-dependent RNA methyltransferase n=1 Tax=Anaerobiospirillum succiniciproducens TaxID=13335 RepID=UPI0023546B42|nr:RsmB/NOP family class I SAM-dependent RNA methyltransferase [Anaerobiospirillum succiniciproducens]MCI6863001.1 RsmB/NOP family class I SAM-dependent RNA methyltransferase [Anaerobiospirillum succiniciproducens]MDY2798727.1 RsmB/NOP family class I SAM-dependent RNA methyltransferase [Anaerobiospirillum succiniciproducens]
MPFDAGTSQRDKRSSKSRTSTFNKTERSNTPKNRSDRPKSFNSKFVKKTSSTNFNKGAKVFREDAPSGEQVHFKPHFTDHDKRHSDNTHAEHGTRSFNKDRSKRSFNDGADKQGRSERSFSNRREGLNKGKDGKKIVVPRRKEIVNDKIPRKPGFTTFQMRLVQSILTSALVDKKPLDKSYAMWFAKVKIPAVEQGFVIRHINAMFRRLSFYAHVAGLKRPSDFERHVNRLILSYYATEGWPLPELNAEGFDRTGLKKRIEEAIAHPLYNEGCPFYLEELCSRELKDKWPAERKALGEAAPRFIRVNTLKTTRDELAAALSEEGVVTKSVKGVHTALEVTSNAALFRTLAFREGKFEQQDAGSQLIAPFLEVAPGMRVIDTCAGSGGKTLHLAALMNGKGSLIAMDIEGWKLDELKARARRAGAFNIETRVIDSTKVIKRLYGHADRVIIDAPCSGLGVLRRTADSKWADIQPRLIELKKIQADILERYSRMVKVGGKVVYSTCSILPSENEKQVKAFLANHPGEFVLEAEEHIWPSSGFDGFYMARLRRLETFDASAESNDANDTTSSAPSSQESDNVATTAVNPDNTQADAASANDTVTEQADAATQADNAVPANSTENTGTADITESADTANIADIRKQD